MFEQSFFFDKSESKVYFLERKSLEEPRVLKSAPVSDQENILWEEQQEVSPDSGEMFDDIKMALSVCDETNAYKSDRPEQHNTV